MMILSIQLLLQILIIPVSIIHSIPLSASPGVETHTFRWATTNDLNNARCAFPSTPMRFPNDTLHPDPEWSKLHGCNILLGGASTPERDRIICGANNSLFILIGNPGMIWHPLSRQCVLIKMEDNNEHVLDDDHLTVEVMHKTLMTSCECNVNNPNVALFKYDNNKPQRLTFLEKDPTTSKKEEWSLCKWGSAASIEVKPKCEFDQDLKYQETEPFFHEVF